MRVATDAPRMFAATLPSVILGLVVLAAAFQSLGALEGLVLASLTSSGMMLLASWLLIGRPSQNRS